MPKCKYCGSETGTDNKVCAHCYSKLPLVKKFVKMCEPYKAIIERRKERNAKEKEQAL